MARLRRLELVLAVSIAAALLTVSLLLMLRPPIDPPDATTPIEHVIVIMKENHSFDNYFGTFPGVDGIPPGTRVPDGRGGFISSHWLNASHTPDLPHGREDMIEAYNGGSNDRFAIVAERWGEGRGNASMGYFDDRQIPGYWSLASEYVIADRYFQSILGPSIPNRLYSIGAQSGGLVTNAIPAGGIDIPTILDQLQGRRVSWAYYYFAGEYPSLPSVFPRLRSNPDMMAKVLPMEKLTQDIRNGTLPSVVYVDPEADLEASEHPPGNVTVGHDWTVKIVDEIVEGPQWPSAAIFLTWDESGGYYDHVPPPQVDDLGYGFRVPMIVVSPFSKLGRVDHTVMDHTSILKFIAKNWNLPDLTSRQAGASDFLSVFDFRNTTSRADGPRNFAWHSGVASGIPPAEFEERVLAQPVPRVTTREDEI